MKENKDDRKQMSKLRKESAGKRGQVPILWDSVIFHYQCRREWCRRFIKSKEFRKKRLWMYFFYNNSGDFGGCHNHFIWLNCICMFGSVLLYSTNSCIFKRYFNVYFFNNYFNDVLAIILLLSFSNILLSLYQGGKMVLHRFPFILIFTLCVGILWEYITPLYRVDCTSDLFDLAAYVLGAAIYYLAIILSYSRKQKQMA